jgi:hypothetical protein
MSKQNDSPTLEDLVRRLPRELAPPAALWPRIEARLQSRTAAPLDLLARRLPADVAPPLEVWLGVASAIGSAPPRRHGRRYAGLAALIVTAVGALIAIATREPQDPSRADRVTVDAREPSASPASPLDAWLLTAPGIPADVADALRRDHAAVQAERVAIERALADAPNDASLRELWAHAYETELELNDIYGRTIMTAYQRGSGI